MRNKDIIKVLGIQGVKIKNHIVDDKKWVIECEYPRKICYCPSCFSSTNIIKDYSFVRVKHKPYGNKKVIIHLRKRRLECKDCGRTFYQPNQVVDKYQRISNTNIFSIYDCFKQKTWSFKDICIEHNIGYSSLTRYLNIFKYLDNIKEFPEVIGIDEFRGNANGNKFQVAITDIKKR